MRKRIFFSVIACFTFVSIMLALDETPEHIYNMATDAMAKGEDAVAIQLFYKVTEQYSDFKKYRPDARFMLGQLLFKTERYDEAEKVFTDIVSKYKKYSKIDKVYEYLIYIYSEEFNDNEKAKKIRALYAKQFGQDTTLANIDRTIELLGKEKNYDILKLDASEIEISRAEEADDFQPDIFPVLCYEKDKPTTLDKTMVIERKPVEGLYYLFIENANKNDERKIPDSKNGYMPQWSWDKKYVIFTSMNWKTMSRSIKLYNVEKNKTKILFKSQKIEPILCFSPDSSKILFIYQNFPWLINRDGGIISKISNDFKVKDIFVSAWANDGDKILVKEGKSGSKYKIFFLAKRELK